MLRFISKAMEKVHKLPPEQIVQVIQLCIILHPFTTSTNREIHIVAISMIAQCFIPPIYTSSVLIERFDLEHTHPISQNHNSDIPVIHRSFFR